MKHGVAAAEGGSLERDEENEAAVGGLAASASSGALVEVGRGEERVEVGPSVDCAFYLRSRMTI